MSRLTTWLGRQNPQLAKSMTPITGVDFLHISTNTNLKTMIPRIGERQLKDEDRSIPRICGCSDLVGCIYGHSAVYHNVNDGMYSDSVDEAAPCYQIYRCNIEEFVRPSKKLVPDVTMTKEIWVVPYSPESVNVTPEKVGMLLPYSSIKTITMGRQTIVNHFILNARVRITFDGKEIEPGYYKFTIKGDLVPQNGVRSVENFKPATASEWKDLMKRRKDNLASIF